MRKYLFSTLAAVMLAAALSIVAPAAQAGDCSVANCREQGGARWHIGSGGSLDVESGGDIDIESGGALKLDGTTVTATATELNLIDGYTGTTAELNALDLTAAMADGDSDKLIQLDIVKPRKQYVRVVLVRGTQNAVIDGIVAYQYGPLKLPTTHDSSVQDTETHVSPAEGTA